MALFRSNALVVLVALQLSGMAHAGSYCHSVPDCDMTSLTGGLDISIEDCICVGGVSYVNLEGDVFLSGDPAPAGTCMDISASPLPAECPDCLFTYCYDAPDGLDGGGDLLAYDTEEECFANGGLSFVCSDICIGCIWFGAEPDEDIIAAQVPVNEGGGGFVGEPHVKSWNGKYFDYHGTCDLVFLDAPDFNNGMGLTIHARTTGRYQYSYISSAAIKIGEDVLEVGSYSNYYLNGVRDADLSENKIGPFKVEHIVMSEKESEFHIKYDKLSQIKIRVFKDLVSITTHGGNSKHFGSSRGLMGTYIEGKLVARDGRTDMSDDLNAFGQEWQVRDTEPMLFDTVRAPQYPAKCILPDPTKSSRRLGETVAKNAAETACAHFSGEAFDACVYDVMATGDLELAAAGAY